MFFPNIEEAKELYPEFENVVDAKTLTDNFTTRSSFYKVKNGKYEGLTLENLSLKLLQSHYGKANPVNSPDKNFGINGKQLSALLQKLNVKELSKNYIMTIYRESDEYTQNASNAERTVLFLKNQGFWIITDYLNPEDKTTVNSYEQNWQMLPLHVEFQGAHILNAE